MQTKVKVGFVGLGIMGKPMAMNVLKAGFPLSVYNRTKAKADEVVAAGATWCDSPQIVAQNSDVIITIVSDTPDVEQVLFGENGVVHGAKEGAVVIDMSTISPQATRDFAARLKEKGVDMLDCPVSGGDIGAIKGTLTIIDVYKRQAGTLGTALALASGLDASAAIALAVPLGLIGNLRLMLRMVINSPITHLSERYALKGNYKMLFVSNVILPQSIYFCTGFIPVFLACIFGPTVVAAAVENLPQWAMNGLQTIGGMLPCIGICINLNNIGKANTMPFFFVGFLLLMYLNFSNVLIAVIGVIIAYVAVMGVKPRTGGAN